MLRLKYSIVTLFVIGTSITACQRQSSDDVLENDPFAATRARPEDQFGKGFGKAYRADPKSEPVTINKGDLIPVSTTTEPVAFN